MSTAYLYDENYRITTKIVSVLGFKKDLVPDTNLFKYTLKSETLGDVIIEGTEFNLMILPDNIVLEINEFLTDHIEEAEDLTAYEVTKPLTKEEQIEQLQNMVIELTQLLAMKG